MIAGVKSKTPVTGSEILPVSSWPICQWPDKPDWAADLNPDSNPSLNWIGIRILQDLNPDYTGFESGFKSTFELDSNPDYTGFESSLPHFCLMIFWVIVWGFNPDCNPDYKLDYKDGLLRTYD